MVFDWSSCWTFLSLCGRESDCYQGKIFFQIKKTFEFVFDLKNHFPIRSYQLFDIQRMIIITRSLKNERTRPK